MPFGVEQCDEIVLGSAFLRTFYSVFALDTNTLGCKSPLFVICSMRGGFLLFPSSRPFIFVGLSPNTMHGIPSSCYYPVGEDWSRIETHGQFF